MDELTTRSRTLLFLSIRASAVRPSRSRASYAYDADAETPGDDEEGQRLLSESDNHPLEHSSPPWIDISSQVNDILAQTRIKISTLDKLHAKHVLPGFADRSAEEREIESLTTDITRDFRKCQSLIHKIDPTEQHSFPPSSTSRQQRSTAALTAQNVQRGLAQKVQDLSGAFRKKQRVYMQKLTGHAVKNQDLLIASGALSLKGSDSISALEEDMEVSRSQLKSQQQQTTRRLDSEVETRSREVTEIAKSISELAELFKDLSTLVIDQGTILDSVEYNIEQTGRQMQQAVKELEVATTYQKNTGRRKCIFLLVLIIVGLILVLIFKPRRPKSSPPADSSSSQSISQRLQVRSSFMTDSPAGHGTRDWGSMFAAAAAAARW
ncbi:hypothetical protein FRC02_009231 [Tulasnella sp. 418]|nr:hypothetical protein FRC02_009231 [Tulasnella sp. 418]